MSASKKHPLLTGAMMLTLAGFSCRIIGFFYRIFLSRTIGAEGMGIYQLIIPLYSLAFALAAAGIQTGISRCCAAAFSSKMPKKARTFFFTGLFLSLLLASLAACLLYQNADFLSATLLNEPRCAPLLKLISFALPLGAIHACIGAWYFSRRQTAIPAIAQFLEQIIRVLASWIVFQIFLEKQIPPSPLLAAVGLLAGELASSLFSGICILFHLQRPEYQGTSAVSRLRCAKELLLLALPLTANRLLLSLLQSGEAILLPRKLQQFGLTSSQSLSVYGVLTAMALPFILFPSAITNAVSTLLLPTIAGEQAVGNEKKIISATEKTIKYCLLLGIFASGIFFFFGDLLGMVFFHNRDAGTFLQILSFLCPFLYLSGTLTSILNGLGHTFLSFLQNLCGLFIRIFFIFFTVPHMGIQGYLLGLLLSQLFITGLNLKFVRQSVNFSFYPFRWLFLPLTILLLACGCGLFFFFLTGRLFHLPSIFPLGTALFVSTFLYLFFLTQLGLLKKT